MNSLTDLLASFPSRGEAPAVIYRTGVRRYTFSYAAMYDLSLRMATLLREQGVVPGDCIVLWGPNSPWWFAAFWGAVAAGAIVVPVDFMSDRTRAESITGLTDARLVIQSRLKAERLTSTRSLFFEDVEFLLAGMTPAAGIHSAQPDDTAELIYTSGTTGAPKGVILTHRNLVGNLLQVNRHLPIVTSSFRFLSLLPLSHMFEQMAGFFTPLLNGAAIVYLRTLKPSEMMDAFAEEDVAAVVLVPRLLQLLRNSVERKLAAAGLESIFLRALRFGRQLPRSLRRLLFYPVHRSFGRHFSLFVSGGASLDIDLARFWGDMGFTVIEGYGLTESSPVLAADTLDKPVPGTVGKPLPGVDILIRDGEILARGDNIFPGYYHNPEATASAFTSDGWFRTGDMGEFDCEGNLRIRGRKKEVIVTGAGINVYPDDIEPVLRETRGVREACVIGKMSDEGERVHAVIVPDASGRPADEILREVNARLDPLQRITGITIWHEPDLPKTTTLKVRKVLVKELVEQGRDELPVHAVDPLVSILVRVTGARADDVREDASLVDDLGLSSIGRLELVNMLEQEYRIDLDDSLIGPLTTVRDLRSLLARRETVARPRHLRLWTNLPAIRFVRRAADLFVNYPLFRLLVRLDVKGRENLDGLEPPVFFIANHVSYLDQPAIMFALPAAWRYRTATAAWEEFFFLNFRNLPQRAWKRFAFEYGSFGLNLFPIPQSRGFRPSLRFMGKLADSGVSILMFPEGERSPTGKLLPFRPGLGLMISELRIPLVPIGVSGLEHVLPRGAVFPRRGDVTVTIGAPLAFPNHSPEEILSIARCSVEKLI